MLQVVYILTGIYFPIYVSVEDSACNIYSAQMMRWHIDESWESYITCVLRDTLYNSCTAYGLAIKMSQMVSVLHYRQTPLPATSF